MRLINCTQRRLDCHCIEKIELDFSCRDGIVPVMAALQFIHSDEHLLDDILTCVGNDVNGETRSDLGRNGFSHWQVLVLSAVRLGCDYDYDQLHDQANNHRTLREMMGIGPWHEQTTFSRQSICDNVCHLKPETLEKINELIVSAGQQLAPHASATARADSFVVETNIHYPTESSLMWDGVRTVLRLCNLLPLNTQGCKWRQIQHLLGKVKSLEYKIARLSGSRKKGTKKKLKSLYKELIERTETILGRAEKALQNTHLFSECDHAIAEEIRVVIGRTRQVAGTARRRVLLGETVPNQDKLFSIFEPHTQLYKRGKASKPIQFGRLLLVFEDGAGFISHYHLMDRDATDAGIAVAQTRIAQQKHGGAMQKISFDRGFYGPLNEALLEAIVPEVCLPKQHSAAFAEQLDEEDETFHASRRRHPGVESAIGALQSGNGMARCRDRGEANFERYLGLGILGRNLHTLGKLLIAQQAPDSKAAASKRKLAA